MKQSEIQVGAKYKHLNYPSFEYLGCGKFNHDDKITSKFLVITATDLNNTRYLGRAIWKPHESISGKNFWSGFYKTN